MTATSEAGSEHGLFLDSEATPHVANDHNNLN